MTAVTATFTDPQGDPSIGYVRFQPRTLRAAFNGGSIVTATRITVPLDGYGGMVADVEPGDYNVSVVLQGSRTFYGVISVPSSDVPIDMQDLLSNYMPLQSSTKAQFGKAGSFEFAVPSWVNAIDYIMSGAGGAGGAANSIFTGQGGWHGAWLTGTLVRGTHFKSNVVSVEGVVGAGGGPNSGGVGNDGQATTLVYTDINGDSQTLTAAGGAGGGKGFTHNPANPNPHTAGAGQVKVTYRDIPYPGGPDAPLCTGGSWPGGGGGGGGGLFGELIAGPGGPGAVFLVGRRVA